MSHLGSSASPAFAHLPFGGIGISVCPISWSTARKSAPLLLLNAPGTFSQTKKRGNRPSVAPRMAQTMSTALRNRPLLAPSNPSLLPAMLKSWQGLPAQMMSTGGIAAPSIFVMSPICVTPGKWCAVTEHGNGSISLAHIGVTSHHRDHSEHPHDMAPPQNVRTQRQNIAECHHRNKKPRTMAGLLWLQTGISL